MRILVLVSLFALVAMSSQSCKSGGAAKSEPANEIVPSVSLQHVWINDDSSSLIPELDFTQLQDDSLNDYSSVFTCDGLHSSVALIDGVGTDTIGVSTTDQVIQFGNLAHMGASDTRCEMSGQRYIYAVTLDTLILCNDTTLVCDYFTKQ